MLTDHSIESSIRNRRRFFFPETTDLCLCQWSVTRCELTPHVQLRDIAQERDIVRAISRGWVSRSRVRLFSISYFLPLEFSTQSTIPYAPFMCFAISFVAFVPLTAFLFLFYSLDKISYARSRLTKTRTRW